MNPCEKKNGTTQNWHMNAREKNIWDYTKLACEQLLFIIPMIFWKQCLKFCHANFLLPNEKNMITGGKEIEERKIFFYTYNCFDQRCPTTCTTSSTFAMLVFELMEYLTMVNNHGVIVLVMKKNPTTGLCKPVSIIIVTGIFSSKNHLKISISHILNPNLTKEIPLNLAHHDLSKNTKCTFQFLQKFLLQFNSVFNEKIIQYSKNFCTASPNIMEPSPSPLLVQSFPKTPRT
jgi:hypothetical protein